MEARQDFFANDLVSAQTELNKLAEVKANRTVADLDLAMVELFQGQPQAAEQRLRSVRAAWQAAQQRALAEEAQAILTDDHARSYVGEVHEQMTLGVLLSLCSLLGDGIDAEAYTLQTLQQQQAILTRFNSDREEPLAETFGIPPVVPYLRGVLREATWHDQDDAARMYQLTAHLLPDQPQLLQDVQRAQVANHSAPGHGAVYVFALVGRGPSKVERSEPVTQVVMLQTEQILSLLGKYSIPPSLAPIKVPALVTTPPPFEVVGVQVNSTPQATTWPLTDFEQLAAETFEAQKTQLMARTVARRIVKKGAIYAAKTSVQATELGSLAMDAMGVAWEATEAADVRCWGLLPRQLQIVRLELPVGQHTLTLEPVTGGYPVGEPSSCIVDVTDAHNTYVLGYWPDRDRVGQLLVSER
jgi:hypothetical protein